MADVENWLGGGVPSSGATGNGATSLPSVAISRTQPYQREGTGGTSLFAFTVTRTGDASGVSSVAWSVASSGFVQDWDAINLGWYGPLDEDDFGGAWPSGTITFASGETTKTLTVPVSGDSKREYDEGFTVTLSNPVGAVLDTTAHQASAVITDDDAAVFVRVHPPESPTPAAVYEGNDGLTTLNFVVSRDYNSSTAFSVDWAVRGVGANPADAEDFGGALPSGTVSFADYEYSKIIAIPIAGDTVFEPDESFSITLSSPIRGPVSGPVSGVVPPSGPSAWTILNDDVADATRRLSITSGGHSSDIEMKPYAGPVNGLRNMHVATGADEAMRGSDSADFINAGGGDDALDGAGGDDVLDGGSGSNWLAGSLGTDTFFLDGRGSAATWSTVTDLTAGEWVTAWGWTAGVSRLSWDDMSGAEGFKGATARIDLDGDGGTDMSLTIAGKASGAVIATPGQIDGSSYLAFTLV